MPGDGNSPRGHDEDSSRDVFKTASVPPKRFWLLAAGVSISLFLTLIDSSIVATSLYTIGIEFEAAETVNWVALSYTLAYLSCVVTFSRLSDVVGRRDTFLAGQAIFVAFSLACGFSQNLHQLIIFRTLQGIGGSELCPPHLEQHIGSLIGIVLAGSGVLGPVLGGILTHYADWRWIFWINGPVGFVSVALFWLTWPGAEQLPTLQRRRWREFDALGSLLIIAASTLVVFAFQNAGESFGTVWAQAVFIAPLVLGICCWIALLLWGNLVTRRFGDRIALVFPVNLFRNRVYASAALSTLLLGFPYLLLLFSFPLREQAVSGKSALAAGLMLLPMLGTTALGSVIVGKINTTRNYLFESLLAGAALMLLACGLLTLVSGPDDDPKALGFLTFAGLGFGLSTSAATMIAAVEAPIKDYAPAQGILAQLRILGGSLGITSSSVLVHTQSSKYLAGILAPKDKASAGSSGSNLTSEQMEAVRQAYSKAFQLGMATAAGIAGVAVLVACLAYKRTRISIQEKRENLATEETARRTAQGKSPPGAKDPV
ncbi:putative transporter-like protein [Hapsidospora chrysogenum ATCC 11550]|uniref:Putative transporter-like protein n=1 Tax=Hapsidospora chrysogenum (strain ATCC 11550 / CBS 779.69 / DSM 880 / IAM 14645 / JCM 23072 / IMI 49137) TaxID=857340 RepID=A0A086SYZ7_HAPC1|nr:putative transporter-like protein [Hapsidospora chrysogenum ATCC 11550]